MSQVHTRSFWRGAASILKRSSRQPYAAASPLSAPSTEAQLKQALVKSLNDGTSEGLQRVSEFNALSLLVQRIITAEHHATSTRLQEEYRGRDPAIRLHPARRELVPATAFSKTLFAVAQGAGFQLCTSEEERRALTGNFGDEQIWNVPVTMNWAELDSSLTNPARGGFDAYSHSKPEIPPAERPSFSRKVIMYHRGVGSVEKTGYFVQAKLEEMAWRLISRLAAAIANPLREWSERKVKRLAPTAQLVEHAHALFRRRVLFPIAVQLRSVAQSGDGAADSSDNLDDAEHHHQPQPSKGSMLSSTPLSLRSLFEVTLLRQQTFDYVLLAYRHLDAECQAHGNKQHLCLALFRNVPQSDFELLLPHQVVSMPPFHQAQYAAFSIIGACAGWPLLFNEALSATGLVTLYTLAAFAARTTIKWRTAKQLYQQQLLSYQQSHRIGSADGALLCVAQLAETEQNKQALLALHCLFEHAQRRQQRSSASRRWQRQRQDPHSSGQGSELPTERAAGSIVGVTAACIARHNTYVLRHWSQISPLEIDAFGGEESTISQLQLIGILEPAPPPVWRGKGAEPEVSAAAWQLKPIDEALENAREYWSAMAKSEVNVNGQTE